MPYKNKRMQRRWHLGQSERRKKLRLVERMEDLVEDQEKTKRHKKGFLLRFWENFQKGTNDECWLWSGSVGRNGYGILSVCNCQFYAHRLAYMIANGKADRHLCVLHSCDNPKCVNPLHLRQGTHRDNAMDAVLRGRNVKGETSGHSTLTNNDIKEIRLRKTLGESCARIAKDYPVNANAIGRIVRRATWKHIA